MSDYTVRASRDIIVREQFEWRVSKEEIIAMGYDEEDIDEDLLTSLFHEKMGEGSPDITEWEPDRSEEDIEVWDVEGFR